jgi:acyl-[acyl-carrier-protein] desaturase
MSTHVLAGASPTRRRREEMYRLYMEFFEHAERSRRWNPMSDIPWEKLESPAGQQRLADATGSAAAENTAVCLETFCAVELFIPDYTLNGLALSREVYGQAWFHLCWGYEESKHSLVFRQYLLKAGLRTLDQYLDYEHKVLQTVWTLPFPTNREMACYGALQEIATYLIYAKQRDKHAREGNEVLARLYELVARDEAAHAAFYRNLMRYEYQEDPQGTSEDLAHVIAHFEMPGVGLVPDFPQRLEVEGVGVSKQEFMEKGLMPTLRFMGLSRSDYLHARKRRELRVNAEAA